MPGTSLLLEDSTGLGWTRVHLVEDLASIGNLPSNQFASHKRSTSFLVCCQRNARQHTGQ